MESFSWAERDRRVIWHPYTQHWNMPDPIPILRGQGCLLIDEQGNSYIDAVSSWWVTLHGHSHPYIAKRIFEQALKLEQVIFAGFTHPPAIELAERLLPLLPGSFSKIFFSDNGSTAVEVALKMAIQYWQNKPDSPSRPRKKILALRNAYHGDTFGSMSLSERGVFTWAFQDFLFEVLFIAAPSAENLLQIQALVRQEADELACFIYEPLLQGAGGMLIHEAGPLDELLHTLRSLGILCIADEVMTGFGRTGKLFAGAYLQNKADILCLSKGLTGGTLAMGLTAAAQGVFDAFLSEDRKKTFFHGHSFTANPIACTAALASLDLLQKPECLEAILRIEESHKAFLNKIKNHAGVKGARILGTVLAFELKSGEDGYLNNMAARVTKEALKNGIYLRPLGNTLYLMPPYCITQIQLEEIYGFLVRLLDQIN
jgi:adenosylmethionine---8-amino-7-oxononanoate aminotransferase